MKVYIFTDNNHVLKWEFAKSTIWACVNFREDILFAKSLMRTTWMKFTTSSVFKDTNSNISVYKTISKNVFFELRFCCYSGATPGL